MKVIELVQEFNSKKIMNTTINPHAVEEYLINALEIIDYLPFADKREMCAKVLGLCNTVDEKTGLVKVDSVKRYIFFTIALLSNYTNLEFKSDDGDLGSLDAYDMLCQNDLLNPILDIIGPEYTTCNNMLNMMMADIVANNNNIENVLGNTSKHVLNILDNFADVLSDKVESLNLDLSQIDIDKYKDIINLLSKK